MGEYIERDAAVMKIREWFWSAPGVHPKLDRDTAEEIVFAIPTADVAEVKRGKWKPFDLTWGRSIYYCTACEHAVSVPTENGKPMFAYCPNCGAKMEDG